VLVHDLGPSVVATRQMSNHVAALGNSSAIRAAQGDYCVRSDLQAAGQHDVVDLHRVDTLGEERHKSDRRA
jgi:hypothetical protein